MVHTKPLNGAVKFAPTYSTHNLVKDHRTGVETGNVQSVMDGNLDQFMEGFLKKEANLTI